MRQTYWSVLANWSPRAFFVAGGLIGLSFGLYVLDVGSPLAIPTDVRGLFVLAAVPVTFVGLFGLYPALADRRPTLASICVPVGGCALLGSTLLTAYAVLNQIELIPSSDELTGTVSQVFDVLLWSVFGIVVVSFLLFGIVSILADRPSRVVGLVIVLTPYVIVGAAFGATLFQDTVPEPNWLVLPVALSAALFGLGYVVKSTLSSRATQYHRSGVL